MAADNQSTSMNGGRRFVRRPSPASLVSIVAHVVLGVLVWNAVQFPAVFDRFLQVDRKAAPLAERIEYVTVVPPTIASTPTPAARRPARAAVAARHNNTTGAGRARFGKRFLVARGRASGNCCVERGAHRLPCGLETRGSTGRDRLLVFQHGGTLLWRITFAVHHRAGARRA